MIAALQKSRGDAQVAPVSPEITAKPEVPENPGDMMAQKIASLESKIDRVLKLLSGNKPADEAKENEPNGNGNGY